jgi:tetratricopeptide (TPR) repeat protein
MPTRSQSHLVAAEISRFEALAAAGRCGDVVSPAPSVLAADHYRRKSPDIESDVRFAQLQAIAGHCFEQLNLHTDAERLVVQAMALMESRMGSNHPALATPLQYLSMTYTATGRSDEATVALVRAEALLETALTQNLSSADANLAGVGDRYLFALQFQPAERLYRRAIQAWETIVGAGHPNVAAGLSFLAKLHMFKGDYASGENDVKRSLAIVEKAKGITESWRQAQIASGIQNLATIYKASERFDEAEGLFKRAISIKDKSRRQDSSVNSTARYNLAQLYGDTGRHADAVRLYESVLASRRTCKVRKISSARSRTII